MTTTDIFIIVWLTVLFVYEIWTLKNRRANDTLSHRVVVCCRKRPWVALALLLFVCLCAGHWFLPYDIRWIWPQPIFVEETI